MVYMVYKAKICLHICAVCSKPLLFVNTIAAPLGTYMHKMLYVAIECTDSQTGMGLWCLNLFVLTHLLTLNAPKKHMTKFFSAKFQIMFHPSYIIMRANSVDSDEVAHKPPHLDLRCLQIQPFSFLAPMCRDTFFPCHIFI